MLENLIKEHAGDISDLLGNKYGLTGEQASSATSSITSAVSGFFASQMSSGKLDLSHVMDLFNKDTPNQGNSLFSGLSGAVSNALSSGSGLSSDTVSKLSSGGLDDILKIFQSGKLGGLDMNTLTGLVTAMGGKDGLSGLLGGLGDLFKK